MNDSGSPWPAALLRLAVLIGAFVALGLLFGEVVLGILAGSLLYLVWNLVNQVRLERWLREGRKLDPPHSRGVWGHIFNGIYRLQSRQRKRRRKLTRILQGIRESINAMPDGAVILREHGEIQWWNDVARELLGFRWPQDEGQRIDNIIRHPEFSAFIRQDHDSARSINLPSPLDESVMLEIRFVPYGINQRLLLVRDITRLYQLERMRRDFVANISHELRTPLTVIQGVSETLRETLEKEGPETARSLKLIEDQSRRMQRLVDDLLILSRLETGQKPAQREPVDVPRMLRALIEEAKALSAEKAQRIELHAESGLLLHGDESELRSAMSNLVFNAVKYTPAQGRITVTWSHEQDGSALFAVEDAGIGIPPHHIPRLTERFYRVDSGRAARSGGTGLGLAIVKHVLGRYDSRLQIASEYGKGSRFSCRFPASLVERRALVRKRSG